MVITKVLEFTIAGIRLRINSPVELCIPQEMEPFFTPGIQPQVHYDVVVLDEPLTVDGTLVHTENGTDTYAQPAGWLRVYTYLEASDGSFAALRLGKDRHHTLYLPRSILSRFQTTNSLSPILGLDYVLMQADCLFLHSSLVRYQGKAVLFSGPSGIGKSTQAELWQTHLGAEILNGDKSCIAKRPDGLFACGSPYAGSSDIFLQEEAPLAGIVLLEHGITNQLSAVSLRVAFVLLYAQILGNTWDSEYTAHLCSLLEHILTQIPVVRLTCTPSAEAVELVRNAFFQ